MNRTSRSDCLAHDPSAAGLTLYGVKSGFVLRITEGLLLCLFAALLVLTKWGALPRWNPAAIASVAVLLIVSLAFDLVLSIRRREAPTAIALIGGILIFGAGLANWLFSLQGFLILSELDAVPIAATSHLQAFDAGPLSDVSELSSIVQLEKLRLVAAREGFVPTSFIRVQNGGRVDRAAITSNSGVRKGSLYFRQGAFGFAPRVVITKNGRTIFDQAVPFTTVAKQPHVLSFSGQFNVVAERLNVRGAIDLASLDDSMRGHEKLGLVVSRDGKTIGQGELLPGHFADLADGYRVGFAGLKKWSEIDISRRTYPQPMIAGAALVLIGGALAVLKRLR